MVVQRGLRPCSKPAFTSVSLACSNNCSLFLCHSYYNPLSAMPAHAQLFPWKTIFISAGVIAILDYGWCMYAGVFSG
jgi:hypothetical protein